MASLSFVLAVSSTIACLFFLAGNDAFASAASSSRKNSKDFILQTSNVLESHVIDNTPHGEVAAQIMERETYENLNHSMLYKNVASECDLFSGTWVHDASYPLYPAGQCPYLVEGRVNCRKNGRPDSDYEKWRWQPRGCSIPRFNAIDMLSRLRGKRLMFVGDSITRGQWESMVCMLQTVIPSDKKTLVDQSSLAIFKALDYNASVENLFAPFLIQQSINGDKKRILHLDTVVDNGVYWKGVDILVFESSHWWNHGKGESWDLIMDGNKVYTDMDPMLAYRKALTTWANWISANIDPRTSLVFFSTTSPEHSSSIQWHAPNGHGCYNEREPVQIPGYSPPVPAQVPIVKQIVKMTRFPVTLLDITGLSEFRKDGHPSVYTPDYNSSQRQNPDEVGDCSHWCLPGVPDTWNQLLYASLLLKGFGSG